MLLSGTPSPLQQLWVWPLKGQSNLWLPSAPAHPVTPTHQAISCLCQPAFWCGSMGASFTGGQGPRLMGPCPGPELHFGQAGLLWFRQFDYAGFAKML
ncbi:unnamed protein product [Boreogadus saida]